ncbi:MaoC family dehydratase [Thalassobaculum sp. OXR-137]|uniref:MaoC family dehydratase n=1 Tax=Thalassobaculum sp. OXR-137 TaxID=3100173 RepID=UPI002AC9E26A|nr:MaoC family dehydratase [Thalassobaculum sp. OXR-137]WPZ34466.1 MaoC family dehydratase [Thalassobaculum sp. OXR-137]
MAGETLIPGFRFPEATLSRDPAAQAEALSACALDPAVWAGQTEPTLWGNDGFRAMTAAGQEIDGYIHVEQRLTLSGALALGEAVLFSGETVSNEVVPRGRRIVQRFEVRRADRSLAVVSEHIRLLPDLEKMKGRSGAASAPPEPVPGTIVAEKVMQPQDVVAYSKSVGNEIHFDPEFAARYGYRAPLAQGLMTMTWMAGYLAQRLRAAPMAILIAQFKRPVFWDDPLTLVETAASDRRQAHLCALNAEGRVACDLRMEVLSGSA